MLKYLQSEGIVSLSRGESGSRTAKNWKSSRHDYERVGGAIIKTQERVRARSQYINFRQEEAFHSERNQRSDSP
jgi:hypothetical protein